MEIRYKFGLCCISLGVPRALLPFVGITALRTVNPSQLGSVAITDNQSWVFSRHCTGGKVLEFTGYVIFV